MIIVTKDEEKEILVQTVSIVRNTNPLATYLFLCPYCSFNIVQIQGRVSDIHPGLAPTDDIIVINKCPRCDTRYTFQSAKSPDSDTKVTLTKFENPQNIWHCYICRSPLLQFNYQDIYLLPMAKRVELPIDIKCYGQNCPAHYYILDVI